MAVIHGPEFLARNYQQHSKMRVRLPRAELISPSLENHAWIGTGAAQRARVLRTIDGGHTWNVVDTPLKSGPSSGIFSIAFRDAKNGVIVGGDYTKEKEAVENVAITNDGGATWTLGSGLSGFRSVVAYAEGTVVA